MLNAITIDVEDWRQLVYWKMTGNLIDPDPAVVDETKIILAILAEYEIKATFFILYNVAKTFPDLIRQIDEAGHEVASHGLSHRRIYTQTQAEFRQETQQAKALLESILGKPIQGYRAAEFSITKQSWWALDILAEEGFVYDSSIYPISGKRYGVPDFPLGPHLIRTGQNNAILEIPLTAIEWSRRRWPIAGGGYFRLLPYRLTQAAVRAVNQQKRATIVYLHPYEFATDRLHVPLSQPSVRASLALMRYATVHNFAREQVRLRFIKLLGDFKFTSIRELIQNVSTDSKIL